MKIRYLLSIVSLLAAVSYVFAADSQCPISLKIALVGDTPKIGSEIRIRVTLTNISQEQIRVASGSNEMIYRVDLLDSAGKSVPKTKSYRFGTILAADVPPGEGKQDDILEGGRERRDGARVRPPGRTGGASGSERLRHPGKRDRSRNGTPSPLLGKSRSEQRRIQDH
jgi:hypothetical protein